MIRDVPVLSHRGICTSKSTDDSFQKAMTLPHLLENDRKAVSIHRARWETGRSPTGTRKLKSWRAHGIRLDEFLQDSGCGAAHVD
jgi:hypothetical protein